MNCDPLRATVRRKIDDRRSQVYTSAFFTNQAPEARESAKVIVPLVLALADVRSVVDLGCGVGSWLRVFREHGVRDVLGIDGHYVPKPQREISGAEFIPADLTQPLEIGRRFDLAVSLEVAEHLPPQASKQFVASLVELSDLVLFSAAIPRQGGSGHLTERWQGWWARCFGDYGFLPVDCVRRRVWSNHDVAWWYAQNTILYVKQSKLDATPRLAQEYQLLGEGQLSLVHPGRYTKRHRQLRRLLSLPSK